MKKTRFDMVVFKKGSKIEFDTLTGCDFILFGGVPFSEKRYMWWNFVSTNQNKIEEAKKRWKNHEFPKTYNEKEFTPLPKY